MYTKLLKLLFLPICLWTLPNLAFSQIIEVNPVYPTVNDSVEVTFHADKCDCGLIGFLGDIYAHTGVMTSGSLNSDDWKYVISNWEINIEKAKLKKINSNTYKLHITPSIADYYGTLESDAVKQLAFVFRSSTGSEKTANIYYDIYDPGLSVVITEPTEDICVKIDSVVSLAAEAVPLGTSDPDSLTLYIDGIEENVYYTNSLEYDYTASAPGEHVIKVVADNAEYSAADSISIFVYNTIAIADLPEGVRDGVNIIDDTTITFVIFAPNKSCILAIGDFNDWQLSNNFLMNQTPDGNRFWITIDSLAAGEEYAFQYLIDGNIRVADPYTEKILDPVNDPNIPASVYPDLMAYPTGKTTGIVSVFKTIEEEYTWQTTSFEAPAKTDLVIYELWVKNYTNAGDIKTLTDTLDYLEQLGINAIELMPVNEFEGNQSWGYNPSFYFAFDKAYGTKNDFKAFVDACHARGIAVIIDLVLNHSYGQSPLLQMYWNETANKPAEDNPWYNVNHNFVDNGDAHWGFDFNHERIATQNLVDSINSYWMSEYKIDGFRFDFTKGMSNTLWYGADNWASAYDASRIAILTRMADEIWARNENAYVIFEHLSDNSEETVLANYGIMLWGNMSFDFSEATMGYPSNFYWGTYPSRGWSEPNLVTYMESHDEERLMYKNQRWGASNDNYDATSLNTALIRTEAAAAFLFAIPGPKMMFQWGELGDDYSINRCADGTVDDNGGCRLTLKPAAWDYYKVPERYRLSKVFEALIKLRIEEDLFETDDFNLSTSGSMKKMQLNSPTINATLIGNFGLIENSLVPGFQHTGTWYDYLTGESIEVSNVADEIILAPGRFNLYTDVYLETPDLPELPNSTYNWQTDPQYSVTVFPNPTKGLVHIETDDYTTFHFELYTLSGQKIFQTIQNAEPKMTANIKLENANFSLDNGIYIYRILTQDNTLQGKLILTK